MIEHGIQYLYEVLDTVDRALLRRDFPRLANLIELANLSSVVGNVFAAGIVRASEGIFFRAGPHKYQDLRTSGKDPDARNVEIKVALERNSPKGHLAKPGHYITVRYVLGNENGVYVPKQRGEVAWVWEVRAGYLGEADFSISSTPGDSGKTAVMKREAVDRLTIIYFDPDRCPYGRAEQHR